MNIFTQQGFASGVLVDDLIIEQKTFSTLPIHCQKLPNKKEADTMLNFSKFCKIVIENSNWEQKGEVSINLADFLVKDFYKKGFFTDNTIFIKMFNGTNKGKGLFEKVKKAREKDFSRYIIEVSERLSNKQKKINFDTIAKKLDSEIKKENAFPATVQEGLLKSYKLNRTKKVFVYLAETLYYSLLASNIKDFEYQEIKGKFSEEYQEILTSPPYALVNTYKERNEKEEIWDKLVDNDQKLFVQGLSGMGKSEFAKDIWKTVRELGMFKYLAWVNYEGDLESSIYNQFLDLVDETPEAKRNKLTKMLREMDDDLLIIVDNFYSTEEKDKFLIELSGRNCHILATTKELLNYSGFENYELESLSEENCVSLFKDYYTLEDDESKMRSIMNSIGRHTLLVELIAKNAYVEEFTLDELIELISENGIDYSDTKVDSTHEVLLTEETIIRQTQLLFSSMQKRLSEEEIDLLIKFSIFKTLHFDKEKIEGWFHESGFKNIKRLTDRGWIKCHKEEKDSKRKKSYSIHAVPAYAIVSQYDLSPYFLKFYSKMSSYAHIHMDEYINELIETIPYIKSFIDTFNPIDNSLELVILQIDFSDLLGIVNQDIQARYRYLYNAKKRLQKYFDSSVDIINSVDNRLAGLHFECDNIDEAEKIYLEVLKRFPNQDENKTGIYNNLLGIYVKKNDFKAVKKYVNKIEKFFKNNSDEENSLNKAIAYINIGNIYTEQKKLTLAKRYLSQAEKIFHDHLFGKKQIYTYAEIDLALVGFNKAYAIFKRENKEYREAEELFRYACTIAKEQFGEDHPVSVDTMREYFAFRETINNDANPGGLTLWL